MGDIYPLYKELPRKGQWTKRAPESITTLVIHHTAGKQLAGDAAIKYLHSVARDHIDRRRWVSIGYHYAIDSEGQVFKCNGYTDLTWHARNSNRNGLGVALLGNFMKQRPTYAALQSLIDLRVTLLAALPSIRRTLAHREVPGSATKCPGDAFMAWLREARQAGIIN